MIISRRTLTNYSLLILISIIWGSQFLFNALALHLFSPALIATSRAFIGAMTLTIILLFVPKPVATHQVKPSKFKYYLTVAFVGLFEATFPFFMIVWGQQHVDSSIAAILIATIPIFTAILAAIFVKHENLHLGTILSVVVGFIGIIVLLLPDLMIASKSIMSHTEGELAILAAALSFASSLVMIRKMNLSSPIKLARDILFAASIEMIIACFIFSAPIPNHFAWVPVLSVLILGIFSAGIVYAMYVILINRAGATFTSLTNYLVPVVGVILGTSLLGDRLAWNEVLAMCIIFVAMICNELNLKKAHMEKVS